MNVSFGGTGSHLAAIDVGTNSFHLVVARITHDGYTIIDRRKETIRLGHGLVDTGLLSSDAIERGVAALSRMRRVADGHAAPIRAVATSAVREAANARTFVERARTEAGVEIEVISGLDEARLIHLGVRQAIPVGERRLLLVDIGGGSTEVLVGQSGDTLTANSFELGAVRLTDRFFADGSVEASAVSSCRSHIMSMLEPYAPEVAGFGFDLAIASSGTAQTVASMAAAHRGTAQPGSFNGFEISVDEIDALTRRLLSHSTVDGRRSVPGLEPTRADIIVAGILVLQAIARTFEVRQFTYSSAALREGILVETLTSARSSAAADGLSR